MALSLQNQFPSLLNWFLLVSDEKVVVKFLIKVEIGQGLLVGRFTFNYFLHLLYAQLADRVEILINLSDHYLLLLTQ
jgi:hypothetical protein